MPGIDSSWRCQIPNSSLSLNYIYIYIYILLSNPIAIPLFMQALLLFLSFFGDLSSAMAMSPFMHNFRHNFRDRLPEIGDYIGTESCIDMKDSEGEEKEVQLPPPPLRDVVETDQGRSRLNRSELTVRRQKREFPPPIPLLARTENLSPHMPWTLRRYYSGDGRLIIREVKVPHHDYFRVNRSGGRLTLDLIPLDDEFPPLGLGIQEEEENQDREEEDEDQKDNQSQGGTEEGNADAVVVKGAPDEEVSDQIGTFDNTSEINPPAGGRGVKLWNYASSCFLKVNVPSIRPVQI